MDDIYLKRVTTTVIVLVLAILSFFLLKPILLSIAGGFLLAFIFFPVHKLLVKLTKSKGISAGIICILLLIIIILPLWFFTPTIIDESIKIYRESQQLNLVSTLKTIFPSIFASDEFSQEVGSIIQSFIVKLTNSLMNYLSALILDFPTIAAQIIVVFFTFFYALRDGDLIVKYVKSLLPFSKEVENKLFDSTKQITSSVLYGQVIIGIIQGLILGAGLFIFKVSNPFVLTIVSIFLCALPIIGPSFVGIPVIISLLIGGNTSSAFGILLFTILASLSDTLTRPFFSRKSAKIHTALLLIGMIGGFIFFGILGFILGPLTLAYLVIIIETYQNKNTPSALIQESSK
jgi:predicted PurR-regulated permease PerM